MIIGLGMPEILEGLHKNGIPLSTAVWYGVLVTILIVVIRIISSFAALIATFLFRRATFNRIRREGMWRMPFVLGWTGMRGVVSLAAALAIPEQLGNGQAFPHRSLILFITFVVILLTLIVQGLTLPYIIKKTISFLPPEGEDVETASLRVKKQLLAHSIKMVNEHYSEHLAVKPMLADTLKHWEEKLKISDEELMDAGHRSIYLELLEHQRSFLIDMNKDHDLDEAVVRRHLYLIDLEEERIKTM